MALKQHKDVQVRFDQQVVNSRNYVLPFIEKTKSITSGTTVLEVGCAEGGVLKPFIESGCKCVGVDLAAIRIETAQSFLREEQEKGDVVLLTKNIYDEDFINRYEKQ